MLTTAPYLRTRRPSPTTAEFIVSTLAPPTPARRLALAGVYLLRLALALGVLLLAYASWAQSPYAPTTTTTTTAAASSSPFSRARGALDAALGATAAGRAVARAAGAVPGWALGPGAAAALWALSRRVGAEERLLVLRGLGIQTRSSGASVLAALAAADGGSRTRFVPTAKIVDVLLHEAFRGFEVRHYLAVVVDGEDDLLLVFPRLLPRPRILEAVWRGVRECLYDTDAPPPRAPAASLPPPEGARVWKARRRDLQVE
ncbi:GPI-GlcNAc transferase complex, PIG-H component-domain-containing protein [Durotheca rogersii]|uniref:GPI-GlcNAc transferase complex, PIG-H component-domain-containing protein n=1 Tax=Durotheca rogersii TaxID=419775 RepID=UPI00221F974A|nr:GPI-GlcNAc transferase complex, PIG-H component-domain-containing protein [Durotheca rogersii]KAI5863519.1 GPI-GlcNAc transferase complex, PIG-H component-domain-containing protein [Durotheca rogersii]